MTSSTLRERSKTPMASMPRGELQSPGVFNNITPQSSSGASSPRRGRARMPVVIMSSQLPRIADNRLHPYSQLSQSPASPILSAKDARAGTGVPRSGRQSRFDLSIRTVAKHLSSPVIRPQVDRSPLDEMPSPLLLPPQRTSTIESTQPLRRLDINHKQPRSVEKATGVDLLGLTHKLGFHVPARQTITPRGSDDEGEDLLTFPGRNRICHESNTKTTKRNARSLCIEEKARGQSKMEQGRTSTRRTLRSAVSDTGVQSPSERRGRSRDVKPCSSTESADRLPIPSVRVQAYTDGPEEEHDLGAAETATVEDMLSVTETPVRPTGRLRPLSKFRNDQTSFPEKSDTAPPRKPSRSFIRPVAKSSRQLQRSSQSSPIPTRAPRRPCSIDDLVNEFVTESHLPATGKARPAKEKKKPATTATLSATRLIPPKPVRALSGKSCPTVVKHIANVFAPASPVSTAAELSDPDGSLVSDASSLYLPRRTASISLKRIQDQDLENIMGSSTIRIPSPIMSPRISGIGHDLERQSSGSNEEEAPELVLSPWQTHGPLHWLREAAPVSKGAYPKARALLGFKSAISPRPLRSLSHQILPSISDSNASDAGADSLGRGILKRSRTASTATEGGDQKRHYTRWDGVETPITKEDHPVHWAVLQKKQQQQQLRRQGSKQSLKHSLLARARSPISITPSPKHQDTPLSNSHTMSPLASSPVPPSRVVSLTSLAHRAVSGLTRPINHRHKSAPLRVTGVGSVDDDHEDVLVDALRSSMSHESLLMAAPTSVAGSFDSKVAYKACKKEEGYVNFDTVLGLDNHAAHEAVRVLED